MCRSSGSWARTAAAYGARPTGVWSGTGPTGPTSTVGAPTPGPSHPHGGPPPSGATSPRTAAAAPGRPAPDALVGDADRDRVTALLADAAADGYLRLEDLDDRLGAAWSARTHGQLARVLADLPAGWHDARDRQEAVAEQRRAARAGLRPHLLSYAGVMALLVTIWLVTAVTAGASYPWPIWPALGWGIGLLGHVRAAYAPVPDAPAPKVTQRA